MTYEKTLNVSFIDVNHNMLALMFGIDEYDRTKRVQAIIHRNRYWHDFTHQPRRNPTMRPLLHNGGKPR